MYCHVFYESHCSFVNSKLIPLQTNIAAMCKTHNTLPLLPFYSYYTGIPMLASKLEDFVGPHVLTDRN